MFKLHADSSSASGAQPEEEMESSRLEWLLCFPSAGAVSAISDVIHTQDISNVIRELIYSNIYTYI